MKLDITSWPRWWEKDNGTHHEMDFVQFIKKLGEHRIVNDKDDTPMIFAGKRENNSRAKGTKTEAKTNLLVIDLDKNPECPLERLKTAFKGTQSYGHTTYSHDPSNKNHCWRWWVFTKEPLSVHNHKDAYWNMINSNPTLKQMSDEKLLDHKADEVDRGYFVPSISEDRKEFANTYVSTGVPFEVNTQKASIPKNDSSMATLKDGEKIPVGERNSCLTKICGGLIRELKIKQDVAEKLHGINLVRCEVPLDSQDVDAILDSIWETHKINHPEDELHEHAQQINEDDFEVHQPSLEVLTVEPPPRPFLFKNFIPEGIVGAIAAQGGVGKSFISLQMCSAAASGHMLYNKWSVDYRGIAVYITGEETIAEVHRRLYYMNRHLPDNVKKQVVENIRIISFADKYFPFIKKDKEGNIVITEHVENITYKLLERIDKEISLIIVDPISRFRDCEENDNTAGTRFIQALQQMRIKLNDRATLLGAAHVNKSSEHTSHSQTDLRGASAVVDAVRFVIKSGHLSNDKQQQLFGTSRTADERYIDMEVVKTNYTPMYEPLYLKVGEHGILVPVNNAGEHTSLAIIQELANGSWSKNKFKKEYAGKDNRFGLAEKPMDAELERLDSEGLVYITHSSIEVTQKGKDYAGLE